MLKFISALVFACFLLSFGFAQSPNDNIAPSITLASATTDARAPSTLFLAAIANDNVGVVRVEFFKGDEKISEASSSPFTAAVSLSSNDIGTVNFKAIAYDAAGNSTESSLVAVAVSGDSTTNPVQTTTPQTPSGTTTSGSITETLSATDDSFTAIVNTLLEVGLNNASGLAAVSIGGTLLDNDLGLGSSAQVRAETLATMLGGEVALFEDGSFSYTPPPSASNQTDRFSYTLSDGTHSAEGTVAIELEAVNQSASVVYVKAAALDGNGSSSFPFGSLAEAQAVTSENDVIVVQNGTYATFAEHHIQLKDGQQLLGQGNPVVLNGQTVLDASRPPTLLRSIGPTIMAANDVLIQGLRLTRTNLSGTETADTSTGSWGSGIYVSEELTGSVTVTNVSIIKPGGFGIVVTNDTGTLSSLTLTDVTIDAPGFAGIAIDDVSKFQMNGGGVSNLEVNPDINGSGRGIWITAEFDSQLSLGDVNITALNDNTQAIFLNVYAPEKETSIELKLSNLRAEFPETGADGATAVFLNLTNSLSTDLELSGQGNSTNSVTPFFLNGTANSTAGQLTINGFDFPE